MFGFFKRRADGSPSVEQQLATLARCGIGLVPGVTAKHLMAEFPREELEADPFRLLLICMGGATEAGEADGGSGYASDNIWHFDTECIEDRGSYAAIARRLRDLAQGELPLTEITDDVDLDGGSAHVAFTLAGRGYRWEAEVKDDWVDAGILSRFADLLARTGKGRRFTYIDLGGQDCLIGCATDAQRQRLAKEIGLKVEWLT